MLPIVYSTKREIATKLLRESIIRGELAPGTHIVLEELGQKYHLSLTPIREAIPILEGEGYVIQLPHKGAIVAPMDRDEIRELYAVRSAMEALATSEGVPRLASQDLAKMQAHLAALETYQGAWEDFLEVDRGFHLVLYQASGRQRWVETIETLWLRCKRYMLVVISSDSLKEFIHADHRQLLQACQQRDVSLAEATIRMHLKRSEEHLLARWQ
jgi:DNA-binding GntR family transcriptional regulator